MPYQIEVKGISNFTTGNIRMPEGVHVIPDEQAAEIIPAAQRAARGVQHGHSFGVFVKRTNAKPTPHSYRVLREVRPVVPPNAQDPRPKPVETDLELLNKDLDEDLDDDDIDLDDEDDDELEVFNGAVETEPGVFEPAKRKRGRPPKVK